MHWQLSSQAVSLFTACLLYLTYMWCDRTKWVWSQSNSIFIFLIDCIHHLKSYILQQTPLKSVNWFQIYRLLKGCKKAIGNKKQKQTNKQKKKKKKMCFVWLYLKINIYELQFIWLDHIWESRISDQVEISHHIISQVLTFHVKNVWISLKTQ